MKNKILATVCFVLSGLTLAVIQHDDTALFYSSLFLVIGIYEFVIGDVLVRRMFPRSTSQVEDSVRPAHFEHSP